MAAPRKKVIITCAVTGVDPHADDDAIPADHAGAKSPTARSARRKAGAAILHLHARDPDDGRPTPDPKVFMQFLPRIKAETDAVINITTGGGHNMTVQERLAAPLAAQPGDVLAQHGLDEFRSVPTCGQAARSGSTSGSRSTWKRRATSSSATPSRTSSTRSSTSARSCGTRFEFECYDVGHLYNLAHFVDRGWSSRRCFVQTIFGILGGIGTDPENLMHMKRIADKLFGDDYHWSILGAGRHQMGLVTMGAIMGGNVRVGLEDSIYLRQGPARRRATPSRSRRSARILERTVARGRDARRSAADAGLEGKGQCRLLIPPIAAVALAQQSGVLCRTESQPRGEWPWHF